MFLRLTDTLRLRHYEVDRPCEFNTVRLKHYEVDILCEVVRYREVETLRLKDHVRLTDTVRLRPKEVETL